MIEGTEHIISESVGGGRSRKSTSSGLTGAHVEELMDSCSDSLCGRTSGHGREAKEKHISVQYKK